MIYLLVFCAVGFNVFAGMLSGFGLEVMPSLNFGVASGMIAVAGMKE